MSHAVLNIMSIRYGGFIKDKRSVKQKSPQILKDFTSFCQSLNQKSLHSKKKHFFENFTNMKNLSDNKIDFFEYFGYPGCFYCLAANSMFLVACWKSRLIMKQIQHRSLYLELFCLSIGGFLLGISRLLETFKETVSFGSCVKVSLLKTPPYPSNIVLSCFDDW